MKVRIEGELIEYSEFEVVGDNSFFTNITEDWCPTNKLHYDYGEVLYTLLDYSTSDIKHMDKSYVYILLDPRKEYNNKEDVFNLSFEPFYVGVGLRDRVFNHFRVNHLKVQSLKSNKIKKILNSNSFPIIKILYTGLTKQEAFYKEIELIKYYGRINIKTGLLTNLTNGGEGRNGYKCTKHEIALNSIKGKLRTGINNPTSIKIYQYNLDGTYVQSFNSITEAITHLGLKLHCVSNIHYCLKGFTKTAYKYQWFKQFQGPKINTVKHKDNPVWYLGTNEHTKKKVLCNYSNGENEIFNSIFEASQKLNKSTYQIRQIIKTNNNKLFSLTFYK